VSLQRAASGQTDGQTHGQTDGAESVALIMRASLLGATQTNQPTLNKPHWASQEAKRTAQH